MVNYVGGDNYRVFIVNYGVAIFVVIQTIMFSMAI